MRPLEILAFLLAALPVLALAGRLRTSIGIAAAANRSLYSMLRRLTGGVISPKRAHEIVEAYTLQFFSFYLLKNPAPLLTATQSPFKEVQFENWFPKNAQLQ